MNYRRIKTLGGCYFFTLTLLDRKSALLTDKINQLRQAFKKVKLRHPFEINAIVIMPEHLHMIMTLPSSDSNYSQRINLIKGNFSRSIKKYKSVSSSRKGKRERGIWQRRFWEHSIRNERDYEQHLNYIHYNPVKHGYVKTPREWRYSSIHRYLAKGILPKNWAADLQRQKGAFGE